MAIPTNGLYRQPPNIPNSIPQNLPKGLLDRNLPNIPNRIPSNLPKGLTESGQRLPLPTTPTPTAKPNIPPSLGTLGNRVGLGLGAVSVGTSIANAVSNPSTRSIGNTAIDVAALALSTIPNPYAQVASFALAIGGKLLFNLFTSPENIKSANTSIDPNTATYSNIGQQGVLYSLTFQATVTGGNAVGAVVTQTARGLGGQIYGFQGVIESIGSPYNNGGVWSFNCTCNGISFIATTDFQVTYLGFGNVYAQPSLVSITAQNTSEPLPNPIPDGQPNSSPLSVNNDGWLPPDLEAINDKLDSLKNAVTGLSDGLNTVNDGIQGLRLPQANNGMPMARPNYVPQPLLNPNEKEEDKNQPKFKPLFNQFENGNIPSFEASPFVSGVSDPNDQFNPRDSKTGLTREQFDERILQERQKTRDKQLANQVAAKKNDDKINSQLNPQSTVQTNRVPQPSSVPNRGIDPSKDLQPLKVNQPAPSSNPNTINDRFRDPSDCKFSCSALAECFVDLSVAIFDGCNADNGTAKTKQITIQVLPKDKARTEASFKELLDIRSKECSLNDGVKTTPEYWLTRRGQIPQAIILFKTTTKQENGEYSYYQLQIPHYNGTKNSKPSIPSYEKGEFMAIYECLDGSQMQVYAASDAEAKRVINSMERYINPRMRMKDKNNIKTGKRGGIARVSVKPIRLDFSSQGQAKKSPDWSIPLK